MALRPAILLAHAVASQHVAAKAEMSVFAAVTASVLCWTTWSVAPHKVADVKATARKVALENGITKEDWEDKVAAVFKVAANLAKYMPADPALLAVRDADDEAKALEAMLQLLAMKGVTCRHYFKQWSKQDNCDTFDPEAANRARRAKEAARLDAMLSVVTSIDASSEAARAAAEKLQSDALAAAEALTPLQRFALSVADINDMAMIDAMFATLNARAAELRDIAAAAEMPAATEPAKSRGSRAASRRAKQAA